MIDQDRDGLINVSDLKEMYSNLGKFYLHVYILGI